MKKIDVAEPQIFQLFGHIASQEIQKYDEEDSKIKSSCLTDGFMSLLPFVVSFLLILVIGSSAFFTSLRSTLLEKNNIFAKHHGLLFLISKEAMKKFKDTKQNSPQECEDEQKKEKKQKKFVDSRRNHSQFIDGKFNLWPLVVNEKTLQTKLLYEKAVNLIEILYQKTDFYKATRDKELANKIVNGMCGKIATSLQCLFPDDPDLAKIYYKMSKGTNTGYRALEEYFKIDPRNKKIQFRYASIEVLQAILGDDLAYKISQQERAKWEAKNYPPILTKKELKKLVQGSNSFDVNLLDLVFDFSIKKDGIPHAFVDADSKVMAKR